MKKVTELALRKSIKKWEDIVAGVGEDKGVENCALCERFYKRDSAKCNSDGELCPVAEATGEPFCNNSPYDDWCVFNEDNNRWWPYRATDDESIMYAVLELEFLKSLLPRKT